MNVIKNKKRKKEMTDPKTSEKIGQLNTGPFFVFSDGLLDIYDELDEIPSYNLHNTLNFEQFKKFLKEKWVDIVNFLYVMEDYIERDLYEPDIRSINRVVDDFIKHFLKRCEEKHERRKQNGK